MGFLIGIAAKLVGERLAGWVAYGTVIIALLGAIWWLRADAYSDGVKATDAKWERASALLVEKAAKAGQAADQAAAERSADEFERVQQEKEKLDAARDSGSSPWDVMFGG